MKIVKYTIRLTYIYLRWVQTDMGNMGAHSVGMKEAPVTVEESVSGLLNKV